MAKIIYVPLFHQLSYKDKYYKIIVSCKYEDKFDSLREEICFLTRGNVVSIIVCELNLGMGVSVH